MRADLIVPLVLMYGLAAIVIAVGKLTGWSDSELGLGLLAAATIGLLVRFEMHDYSEDR